MFNRSITETLLETVKSFPVTTLTGPRQSGKTTILKTLFPQYKYINLEDPDVLLRVKSDPRGFLNSNSSGWIIDEAQQFPDLFSYLQGYVDKINKPGMLILSGSQNFLLTEKISQTLAGRAAILQLLPLSYNEFLSNSDQAYDVWQYLYHGSYPRPYNENLNIDLWYSSYIHTYLERDVRSLINVRDLSQFQLFLKLCAGRHGQLLNIEAVAADTGISHTTARQWLSILEASYIVYRLQPYYRNFNKRLVKTPKLYFYDSAIVCKLLGIESADHLQIHSSRGAIFEGFVITEIIKYFSNNARTAPVYFWRDHLGMEVDCLIEKGEKLISVEVKSGKTINSDAFKTLYKWHKVIGNNNIQSNLIYTGPENYQHNSINVLPWNNITEIFSQPGTE